MRLELALALGIGCAHPPACPRGTEPDPPRAQAVETRLASAPEGAALLATHLPICFGAADGASVITNDRVVVLARDLEEGEAAARLGHLLVHAREGMPIDQVRAGMDPEACDAGVDRALALEAHAYVVEMRLQRALDAHPVMLRFELAPDASERAVATYLHEHPDGAPGIDGLASAYRAICAR